MTAKEIEYQIATRFFNKRQDLIVPNVTWGFHNFNECDLLICTKSDHLIEVEIKISKADIKKDKEKKHDHNRKHTRELYFAIPESLQKYADLIPEDAGIILVHDKEINLYPNWVNNFSKYTRKEPSLFRKAKINKNPMKADINDRYILARLGTIRMWNHKRELLKLKEQKNLPVETTEPVIFPEPILKEVNVFDQKMTGTHIG